MDVDIYRDMCACVFTYIWIYGYIFLGPRKDGNSTNARTSTIKLVILLCSKLECLFISILA